MAQENSNSTMEMGTSDQVLVPTKSKKTTYIIGFVAMLVAIGVVITLVVVLSGNEGGTAEPIISTTEGPTSASTSSSHGTSSSTTPIPPSTEEPVTDEPGPELAPLELEDILNGVFSPVSFNATWTSGSDVLFRNENGDLVVYDVDTDSTTPLILNSSETLQQSSRVMQLSPDGNHVVLAVNAIAVYRFSFLARYVIVDVINNVETVVTPPLPVTRENEEPLLQNFVWGPTGTSFAFVYYNNIYYQASLSSPPQQITNNGQQNVIYNGIPDWVYEEEVFGSNVALWFSKDGSKLAYVTFDDTNVRVMRVPHYGLPGHVNYQYTQHHEIRYPKPGTTNPTVTVTLRDISTGASNVYAAPSDIDQPILKVVTFVSNDSIALMWSNRVQTTARFVLCTHGQTTCTTIYNYNENGGWIENIPMIFNTAGDSFITVLPWAVNGVRYKQIVQFSQPVGDGSTWTAVGKSNTPHTVAEILHWSSDDTVWYKATHESDSAQQHIYSANSTGYVTCFTCDLQRVDGRPCLYNDASMSSDGLWLAVTCAGPDVPQVFVYSNNGTQLRVWDDNSLTEEVLESRALPETIRLSVTIPAALPSADVHLMVPADYKNRTDVPLLVYVYAGPDTALVTEQWSLGWESSLVSRWGIAVAQIDGRGSGLRGVDNMFAVDRKLGTVEIDDQIHVTKYLKELYPWLSPNRTCIWGWSYGGYAASLALARGGDVFQCAAAVAPVVDWRYYDTIYTERYMDVPENNAVGYAQSSLLSQDVVDVYRNKSYFLIHGTADDNVHYQHAMLFSRLLQKQNVYFHQMSYTDEDHGLIGVRPHLYHALEKFLRENMLY